MLSMSNLFLGDQYLAIVVPGRMFKTAVDKTDLSPRMLSRTLEDSGTLTAVLIPWTGCGASRLELWSPDACLCPLLLFKLAESHCRYHNDLPGLEYTEVRTVRIR